MSESTRFNVSRLGAQGDGISFTESGPVYIRFALPDEVVTAARAKDRATLISVIEPSPLRVEPACRHFGECGGCAIQQLEESAYHAWKRDKVVQALKSQAIDETSVGPLVPCLPHTRRRAVFSVRRTEKSMLLGYNRALSHTIIDIEECPLLVPEIASAFGKLRALAGLICNTSQPFHLTVTASATGLDIAAQGSGALTASARQATTQFVLEQKIARLAVDGEIIVEPVKPMITFGSAQVTPPPGGFLQAVASAEQTMASLVANHLKKAKRVVDLFAGSGAFALRLAEKSEVHAVEGEAAALAALDRGARFASGLKRVTVEKRDLFNRPVTFKELNNYGGVIFDPPRAGADDQSKQIARSNIPLVAAVSCNPLTLARDLRILIDSGYRLTSVTPIDQFLWSPHVEAVALLEKKPLRR